MMSMRTYLAFWVSGLIAGVVLMERWRRHGGRYVPVDAVASTADAAPPDSPTTTAPAKTPGIIGLVVTGAKLDAERVRRRLRPGTHT